VVQVHVGPQFSDLGKHLETGCNQGKRSSSTAVRLPRWCCRIQDPDIAPGLGQGGESPDLRRLRQFHHIAGGVDHRLMFLHQTADHHANV
jgi:hypothetical protein